MSSLESRSFDEPDEVVSLPLLREEVVVLGEVHVARIVHEPGWSWSEHMQPVVGTPSCLHHHQGVVVSGAAEIVTDRGAKRVIRAGGGVQHPAGPSLARPR